MSVRNHPNFNACGFVTDIIVSYYNNIRDSKNAKFPFPRELMLKFVGDVERGLDNEITLSKMHISTMECSICGDDVPCNCKYGD